MAGAKDDEPNAAFPNMDPELVSLLDAVPKEGVPKEGLPNADPEAGGSTDEFPEPKEGVPKEGLPKADPEAGDSTDDFPEPKEGAPKDGLPKVYSDVDGSLAIAPNAGLPNTGLAEAGSVASCSLDATPVLVDETDGKSILNADDPNEGAPKVEEL